MTPNTNVVRTALTLALVTLMGAGCFWLEPIAPHNPDAPDSGSPNPGDPDAGNLPDGGSDPDAGIPPLACGPDTPVPAGASVALAMGERAWMYLDPGDTLIPGDGGLRLQLGGTFDAKVPVQVRSTAVDVVEPESDWVCIPPGASEAIVGLQALEVGETRLEVLVGGTLVGELQVTVVDSLPTFTLVPRHGYYNPGDRIRPTLVLSHPSPSPFTVNVMPMEGSQVYASIPVEAGLLEVPYEDITFENTPAYQFRLDSPELGYTATIDFRRTVRHLLISEVLLNSVDGFIELYNPTEEMISLDGKQLVIRHGWDGHTELATFQGTYAVEPRSYFLVGWGSRQATANLVPSGRLSDLDNAYKLFLGTIHSSGKSMATVDDALQYEQGWVHGAASLERQAWSDANADDLDSGGRYEVSGNAHDSDPSTNPSVNALDFVVQPSANPQNALSDAESFFTP